MLFVFQFVTSGSTNEVRSSLGHAQRRSEDEPAKNRPSLDDWTILYRTEWLMPSDSLVSHTSPMNCFYFRVGELLITCRRGRFLRTIDVVLLTFYRYVRWFATSDSHIIGLRQSWTLIVVNTSIQQKLTVADWSIEVIMLDDRYQYMRLIAKCHNPLIAGILHSIAKAAFSFLHFFMCRSLYNWEYREKFMCTVSEQVTIGPSDGWKSYYKLSVVYVSSFSLYYKNRAIMHHKPFPASSSWHCWAKTQQLFSDIYDNSNLLNVVCFERMIEVYRLK